MLLALPDVRQTTPYSCGDAAIATVLGFHGIVAAPRLATAIHGLDPVGIERYFTKLGLSVISGSFQVKDLAHFCDSHRPPIALGTWPDGGDSHWTVVRGVSRGRVYYQCPLDGPESLKVSEWDSIWHGEPYQRWAIVAWKR